MRTLLPPNATTLERAVDLAFASQIQAIPENRLYDQWNPDTCPEELLGYLAWAVSVDDWSSHWGEATKRQVIAASLDVHRHKGTLSSIKRVLSALGVQTEMREYPQTSVPHTIEAIAYANQPLGNSTALLDETAIATVRRNIEFVKPARTSITLKVGAAFTNTLRTATIAHIGAINRITASTLKISAAFSNTPRTATIAHMGAINRITASLEQAKQSANNAIAVACTANVQPLLRLSLS